MTRGLTDAELEGVLGHVFGLQLPTLEERGAWLAAYFAKRAGDRPAKAYVKIPAAALRTAARTLDALVGLSREGVDS